jgi:Acetyltransferase (GNAT) domain
VSVYQFNPLDDPRWPRFLDRHPDSSVFHSPGWLEALRRTYGYDPVAYSTTPPAQELENGLVFCRIHSWLSGGRLVSLPFSDHCQPLAEGQSFTELMDWLNTSRSLKHWKYVELRPLSGSDRSDLVKSGSFSIQTLDLRPDLDILFRNFHKSCVQRKVHRAERERLAYQEGRSEAHLSQFYELMLLTRRRHGLPPQPLAWFRNVLRSLGAGVLIRVASKDGQPIASMITMQFKEVLVYKYGCSDSRFNNLGGNSLLFWKAIQDAKSAGHQKFDLGRSETDNPGLISFKENWGATSIPLHYYRQPAQQPAPLISGWRGRFAKSVFSIMPNSVLSATGRLLYRHIG